MRIISNMNCRAIINFPDLQSLTIASVSALQSAHQSLNIFLHHSLSKPKANKSQKIKWLKPEPYHPCYQHLSRHFRGRAVSHLEVHVQTNIHLSNWGAIWCRQSLFATPLHTHTHFLCVQRDVSLLSQISNVLGWDFPVDWKSRHRISAYVFMGWSDESWGFYIAFSCYVLFPSRVSVDEAKRIARIRPQNIIFLIKMNYLRWN